MIIIIGFILLLGLFLIIRGIKYRSEITSNKEKVDRYVLKSRNPSYITIKDNKKGWMICEFMTGDKTTNHELAVLCLDWLENNRDR